MDMIFPTAGGDKVVTLDEYRRMEERDGGTQVHTAAGDFFSTMPYRDALETVFVASSVAADAVGSEYGQVKPRPRGWGEEDRWGMREEDNETIFRRRRGEKEWVRERELYGTPQDKRRIDKLRKQGYEVRIMRI